MQSTIIDRGTRMVEALLMLASTAGTTLVAAMATDAWQAARAGFARLFGRTDPSAQPAIEAQLDRHEALVASAEDRDETRQRLVAAWRAELETVLKRDPAMADDVRALLTEVQEQLPAAQRAWIVQNVTVSGSNNLTNVVAGGNVIHHGPTSGSAASTQ